MTDRIWVTTDAAGFIIECSPAAVELIGYSARGARGRELPNLFVKDRPRLAELLRAAQGDVVERPGQFRPNDRKPVDVRFRIERVSAVPAVTLRWTFDVRWPVSMRVPRGVDRRQMITVWRREGLRCVFLPGESQTRRLFVCAHGDEVIHEEAPSDGATAYARATELQDLASRGMLGR